jgi:HK97 family phage prohead protease
MTNREAAALARSEATQTLRDRPSQRRSAEAEDAPRHHARMLLDNASVREAGDGGSPHVVGVASVTERSYEMWDFFGPYTETVAADAFDKTLAAGPLVEFTLNHNKGGGAPMASTRNGTLDLRVEKGADLPGLHYDAEVDGTRNDVADMVKALKRGDLAEASFKFFIKSGQWSPDFTEYRIEEVDLHGGDVTAANFGANPHATSALRGTVAPKSGREIVREDDLLPARSL